MKKLCRFSIIIIVSIFVASSFSQSANQEENSISLKVLRDNQNCRLVLAFLRDVVSKASKTGGMAMTKNSCSENTMLPELKSGAMSLNEMNGMLDLIVRNNPNYVWKNDREVINLLPAKAIPALLEVRIAYLKVSFDRNLSAVVDPILKDPEFIKRQKELDLREGVSYGGLYSPPSNRPPTEIVFRDKTVIEILNEVMRAQGRGFWLYRETDYGGFNRFSLDFVSR